MAAFEDVATTVAEFAELLDDVDFLRAEFRHPIAPTADASKALDGIYTRMRAAYPLLEAYKQTLKAAVDDVYPPANRDN